ncbi:HlyC/CorC family transporter [Pseudorhodoplanes sp.]|uniref:HlyC/CorC family transporter n=1 Tax=Pseudorhodoplanes sp. TaxID=1934341 RepID=UPI003918D01A
MDAQDWLALLAILLCLLLSFFFSGSETALTALSRARMLRMEKGGNPRARIVNQLIESRERLIGGILLGNNLVNIAASSLATGLLLVWFGPVGVVYATIAMTAIVVVFTEVLPKTIAINAPERIALLVSRPIRFVVTILGPVLIWIERFVRLLLAQFGMRVGESQPILAAREELRGAVDLLHREGGVEKHDRDMMGGVLDLRELEVSDVMIHRTEMITVCADDRPEIVLKAVLDAPVTRIPLWSRTPDNFVGILHVRDLLVALQEAGGNLAKIDVVSLARPPWFVPTVRSLTEQLKAFRRRRTPLALVVDEYGEVMGLVTLEDIIEEIVGDITDEHDVNLPGVWPQPDGSVHVEGSVPIRDLNRAMEWNLPDEQATTIAGLVIHEARSIPDVGQTFTFYGFRFGVLMKDRNRITSLRITPLSRPPSR